MKTVSQVAQKETGTVDRDENQVKSKCGAGNGVTGVCEMPRGTSKKSKPAYETVELRKEGSRTGVVCIAYANGCPRSRMSAARLFPYFEANGWSVDQDFRKADLVLVSTCGVNQRAEKKSLRLLSIADRKKKNSARLVILGCLAGINEKILRDKFNASVIAPTASHKIDDVIDAKVKLGEIGEVNLVHPIIKKSQKSFSVLDRLISEFEPSKLFLHRVLDCLKPKKIGRARESAKENAFSIRILNGCPGECAYCAIKFAEGPLVSRPMEAILAEFDAGLEARHRNIFLIGTDVGAYGQDIGTDIRVLLQNLLIREGDYVLHFPEFHPRWFIKYQKDLTDMFLVAEDKIGSIIAPIESGSERILELMRRGYTAAEAKECLLNLRMFLPNIQVYTHVLVGFPGESEKDFDDTVRFLREVPFDEVAIYKYEARPNVESEELPGKVSEKTKHKRVCRLLRELPEAAKVAL